MRGWVFSRSAWLKMRMEAPFPLWGLEIAFHGNHVTCAAIMSVV